jgi:class 3 adenylate cyclase/HEAT repeat protein
MGANNSGAAASSVSINFRQKIATVFTLLITFIMLISVFLVTYQVKKSSLSRAEESGRMLGKIIALSMGEDIVRGNFQSVNYALKEFSQMQRIEYCLILDNYGKIISSTDESISGNYFSDAWSRSALNSDDLSIRRGANKGKPVYDTTVPIVIGGKRHAIIRVGFTLDEEYSNIRSLLAYNLSLGIILILGGVFVAYAVSATLLSPLNAILNSLDSMSKGDFSQHAFVSTSDEFEQLAESFNKLSDFLQSRQNRDNCITRKLWESDASLKQKHFSGKNIEAVVAHIELNRFAHFIERHSASESVDTINFFFEQASEIITASGGILDKFGDGYISAIFPVVANDKWPAFLRAAYATFLLRSQINEFNFKQSLLGLEDLQIKMGLAVGKIIVGNIGTSSKNDFSVLGTPVLRARKAAALAGSHNEFKPVAATDMVNLSSDFLLFKQLDYRVTNNSSDETAYYSLDGFANLSYFKERLKVTSQGGGIRITKAFGLTESEDGLKFLQNIISESDNNELRIEAIKSLTPFLVKDNSQACKILTDLLENSNEDPQILAVTASTLGLIRDDKLADCFTALFSHDDDRVRANAVESCIPLEFADKKEILKKMLEDEAPRVCANALLGLWLANDQETLPSLYKLLKADNSQMRASGAYAIYFLSLSRRFRRLFPAYSEEENFTLLPIIENILNRLKAMLESNEISERYQALRALGKVGFKDFKVCISELISYETEPEILSLAHAILAEWDFHDGSAES